MDRHDRPAQLFRGEVGTTPKATRNSGHQNRKLRPTEWVLGSSCDAESLRSQWQQWVKSVGSTRQTSSRHVRCASNSDRIDDSWHSVAWCYWTIGWTVCEEGPIRTKPTSAWSCCLVSSGFSPLGRGRAAGDSQQRSYGALGPLALGPHWEPKGTPTTATTVPALIWIVVAALVLRLAVSAGGRERNCGHGRAAAPPPSGRPNHAHIGLVRGACPYDAPTLRHSGA